MKRLLTVLIAIFALAAFAGATAGYAAAAPKAGNAEAKQFSCPTCGVKAEAKADTPSMEYKGTTYHFCCAACLDQFKADPENYVSAKKAPEAPATK